MIDRPSVKVKLLRNAPIAIAWKLQADALNCIAQRRIFFQGRGGRRKALMEIPATIDAEYLAELTAEAFQFCDLLL